MPPEQAPSVKGQMIDAQTRCVHYASLEDVVAIQCYRCRVYYPCYRCHNEYVNHPFEPWPSHQWHQKAVLCGVCKHRMRIQTYLETTACPCCKAPFNPGCHKHHSIYFNK